MHVFSAENVGSFNQRYNENEHQPLLHRIHANTLLGSSSTFTASSSSVVSISSDDFYNEYDDSDKDVGETKDKHRHRHNHHNGGDTDTAAEADVDAEPPALPVTSFLVACAANLYEYYDFALLGFFASQISRALFPRDQAAGTSMIAIYALYAAGFLARPFGGIVFGYFGDRYGRKNSLRMAMLLMSFPTFLTGCIPTYDMIGIWAPFILLVLRLVQGLSTGGENSSASIYVYEMAPKHKRAFWLSIFGICSSGTLIASISHVIVQNLCTTEQMFLWGWRLPFFAGIGLFFFSLWAKGAMDSTKTFVRLENSPYVHRNPIRYVCSHNGSTLLKFIFASSIQHGSAYMLFVFLPSFMENRVLRQSSYGDRHAYTINCINSVTYLPLILLVGYCTDITANGALKFLIVSNVVIMFLSPFLFFALSVSDSFVTDWVLQFALVLACVPMWGSIFFWYISELLPDPRTRVTIYGVGYNLGAAIFGGTASLIGSALVESAGATAGMVLSGTWMSLMALMCLLAVGYVEFVEKPTRAALQLRTGGRPKQFDSMWYLQKTPGAGVVAGSEAEEEDEALLMLMRKKEQQGYEEHGSVIGNMIEINHLKHRHPPTHGQQKHTHSVQHTMSCEASLKTDESYHDSMVTDL